MAKVLIKSETLTPFGGIFSIMEQFDSILSPVIDSTLGQRCSSIIGYQFSEIVRSLMSVYFCGGSCVEDVTSHLMRHLSYHPTLRTCSSDTILRAIKELTQENISYTSDQGKTYDFNTADKLNTLLINALVSTGELKEDDGYDVDFNHQFLDAEKYDAKPTYKKFLGYRPGVYVIGDMIVYVENSDGNTNVRFHQADTHKRFFSLLDSKNIRVNRFRADCGSCSKEIVSEIEKHCRHFYIRANRCSSLYNDIFALRGWKTEEINGIQFEQGDESLVQSEMRQMKNKYSSKGYPVVLGEFGSLWRDIPQGENQDVHNASIRLWYKTVCKYAIRNGIIPFVWDTNFCGHPSGTIVDRKNLSIFNQFAYDGMMEGCQSERWPFTTDITAPAILSTDDMMYDLNGRQLKSEPTKGLYIRNGKKVWVK